MRWIDLQNKKHADLLTMEVNRSLDPRRWWAWVHDPGHAWLVVPSLDIIKNNREWMPSKFSYLFMDTEDNIFFALEEDADAPKFLSLRYPEDKWRDEETMGVELALRAPHYQFRLSENWLRNEARFPHDEWQREQDKAAAEKRGFALRLA